MKVQSEKLGSSKALKPDNAAGIRAVYEALKEKILLQKQIEHRKNSDPEHK